MRGKFAFLNIHFFIYNKKKNIYKFSFTVLFEKKFIENSFKVQHSFFLIIYLFQVKKNKIIYIVLL